MPKVVTKEIIFIQQRFFWEQVPPLGKMENHSNAKEIRRFGCGRYGHKKCGDIV